MQQEIFGHNRSSQVLCLLKISNISCMKASYSQLLHFTKFETELSVLTGLSF